MSFTIRVYDGQNVLEERGPYTRDGAEEEAFWHVHHDGATSVDIIDDDTGMIVDTIRAGRRSAVR